MSLIEVMWCALGGLAIGAASVLVILLPRVRATQELDKNLADQNEALRIENANLNFKKENLANSISDLSRQAEEAATTFYEKNLELANTKFEQSAEKMSEQYKIYEQECKDEYFTTLQEAVQEYIQSIENYKNTLKQLENKIDDKRAIVAAAVAAQKRTAEMENQKDFYRLTLSDEDIQEIKRLREVLPYLRDSEPLNKVIWKVYYEKPYNDLIGRVVGSGIHTGIYKITNIEEGKCYVGQAANIADRWRQHIKRGIGAEAATRNKLYPAMLSLGVENFTFEIVEECDRTLLNEREDYWQDYFYAKEFGYSIK